MRPRVFPAEDSSTKEIKRIYQRASMRPRVFPAEDSPATGGTNGSRSCFNEAAGIPRGRPTGSRVKRWLGSVLQ